LIAEPIDADETIEARPGEGQADGIALYQLTPARRRPGPCRGGAVDAYRAHPVVVFEIAGRAAQPAAEVEDGRPGPSPTKLCEARQVGGRGVAEEPAERVAVDGATGALEGRTGRKAGIEAVEVRGHVRGRGGRGAHVRNGGPKPDGHYIRISRPGWGSCRNGLGNLAMGDLLLVRSLATET